MIFFIYFLCIKNEIYNDVKFQFLIKFFLFSIYIYFSIYSNKIKFIKYKSSILKICICTLGKEENRYIKEFVEYYKNYGVDKIYLYDNNDINGERFETVIGNYVENKFVEIINWRGVQGNSTYYGIMNSCYQNFHNEYDWLIFYELDEFLFLKNYKNVKLFLVDKKFDKCQSIQLNWVHMSDNNNILYENKSLHDRFPKVGKNIVKGKYNKICYVKTIIRGHLNNISITQNHILSENLNACNGFGEKPKLKRIIQSLKPDYEFYFIKHYYGKSIQEFVEKINRGDLLRGNKNQVIEWAIEKFFYINEITPNKISYIQKYFKNKYNLTKYILKLEKNKL